MERSPLYIPENLTGFKRLWHRGPLLSQLYEEQSQAATAPQQIDASFPLNV